MVQQQGEKGTDYSDTSLSGVPIRLRFAKNWRHIAEDHASKRSEPWRRILPADVVEDFRKKGKKSDQKRSLKHAVLAEIVKAFSRAMLIVCDVTYVESGDKVEHIEALGPSGLSMYCRFGRKTETDGDDHEREIFHIASAYYKMKGDVVDGNEPLWYRAAKKRVTSLAPFGKIEGDDHHKLAGRKKYLPEVKECNFDPVDEVNWGIKDRIVTGQRLPDWKEAERYYSKKTLDPSKWSPPVVKKKNRRRKLDQ